MNHHFRKSLKNYLLGSHLRKEREAPFVGLVLHNPSAAFYWMPLAFVFLAYLFRASPFGAEASIICQRANGIAAWAFLGVFFFFAPKPFTQAASR